MQETVQALTIVAIIWYTVYERSNAKEGKAKDHLSTNEKVLVWVLSFLNPILTGAIMYFGLRKLLPNKAKQINRITFITLGVVVVLFVIFNIVHSGF